MNPQRLAMAISAVAVLLSPFIGASFGQTFWTDGTGNWNTSSNWTLGVPNAGSGTAFDAVIENGGTAQLLTLPDGSVRRLRIGRAAGAGNVLVDAASLSATQDLYLNENGVATSSMTVRNGSTASAPVTSVGQLSSANTNFTISGSGTVYNATTQFIAGNAGNGTATVTVDTAGTLNSGAAIIGNAGGSTGVVTVKNPGSTWSPTTLTVGNVGTGVLNILDQGEVYVGTALSINGTSNVILGGGTLRFATVTGLNRLTYSTGTIQLSGNRNFKTDPVVTAIYGASPLIPTSKGLTIEGDAQIFGSTVTVSGGTLTTPQLLDIEFSGDVGMLQVVNGGKVTSLGGLVDHGYATVDGPGSTWTIPGDLILGQINYGDLSITNQATVYIGGTIHFGSGGNVLTLNGGTLRFDGYAKGITSINYSAGTLQLAGDRTTGADAALNDFFGASPIIPVGKALVVEGTATITSPNSITLTGGSLTAGTLAISPGARLTNSTSSIVTGSFVTSPGSTIDSTGGDLVIGDSTKLSGFYCDGTIKVGSHVVTLADSNDAVFDSGALVTLGSGPSPGTLNAANGLTLDFGGNITGTGTISTPNNIAKPLINNGHITGTSAAQRIMLSGYAKGVGTFDNVNFTGTFAPGLSPTILTVGNLSFSPASTLIMELGGVSPGSGYDQIQSSGTLAFGGTLQVSLIDSFTPTSGQSFNLFDWVSSSGTFSLQLPTLAGGLQWDTSQLYTSGTLSVSSAGVPGDYNNNGTVEAGDYILWRKYQGTTHSLPNDPTGGTIGVAQYNTWRSHFGQPPGSGSGSSLGAPNAAVPEPAPLAMILTFAAATISWQRSNRQCLKTSPRQFGA